MRWIGNSSRAELLQSIEGARGRGHSRPSRRTLRSMAVGGALSISLHVGLLVLGIPGRPGGEHAALVMEAAPTLIELWDPPRVPEPAGSDETEVGPEPAGGVAEDRVDSIGAPEHTDPPLTGRPGRRTSRPSPVQTPRARLPETKPVVAVAQRALPVPRPERLDDGSGTARENAEDGDDGGKDGDEGKAQGKGAFEPDASASTPAPRPDAPTTVAAPGASTRPPEPPLATPARAPRQETLLASTSDTSSLRSLFGRVPVIKGQRVYEYYPKVPESFRALADRAFRVEICVSDQGAVSEVMLDGATDPLGAALRDAIRTWRYRPQVVNGTPMPFCHRMRIRYVVN